MKEVGEVLGVVENRYSKVYNAVKKQDKSPHQNKARTLSYILQEMETAVSALAVQYLIDNNLLGDKVKGAYVMSFLHDGFYVLNNEKINEALLSDLAAYIKDQSGLDVKFGFKRVNPEFTAEEAAAIKETKLLSASRSVDWMMKLARQAFTFPEGTEPEGLNEESVLRTNNGYEIAIIQHGIGCAQVDIRTGGTLFQSKCLFEVDTIDNDREARTEFAHRVAQEVYGEDAVVDVQIRHNAGEYIKIREQDADGEWVDVEVEVLLKSNERRTIFIKGSMGGGKSYLVTDKMARPLLRAGGSAMFLSPNTSLVTLNDR